jgi:hypothetical protein
MTLTVKELIEKLTDLPEDYLIYSKGHFRGSCNIEYISFDDDLRRIYINISKPEIIK